MIWVKLIDQFNNNHHVFQGLNILILQNKSINYNSMETCKFIFYAFELNHYNILQRQIKLLNVLKRIFPNFGS